MTRAKHGKRLSTFALLVLAWVGLGMLVPVFLSLDTDEMTFRGAGVTAAPGDSYTIAAPVRIFDGPGIVLERASLQLVGDGASSPEAMRAKLAAGEGQFVLEGAAVSIGATATPDEPEPIDARAPLVSALTAGRFERIHLNRSRITLHLGGGLTETLTNVAAEVQNRRRSGLQIKGAGQLRGHDVNFTATLGAERRTVIGGPAGGETVVVPLKLALRSRLMEATVDGRLETARGLSLHGRAEASVSDLRQLARALGAPWPVGPGLKELKLSGPIKSSGRTITFETAAVQIDRNAASGTLTARFDGERPAFGGTLAFKSFDLGRYLTPVGDRSGVPQLLAQLKSIITSSPELPLIRHLDADLRVSAGRILLGDVDLGAGAATVTVNASRLLADIAELEIAGGRARGQIQADMASAQPRLALRGHIDEMNFETATEALAGQAVASGRGSVHFELSAAGMLSGVSGRIAFELPNGGRIFYDHRALLQQAARSEFAGWRNLLRGQTALDRLDVRLSVRNGIVSADQVVLGTGEQGLTATGIIDLIDTGRLDLRVFQRGAAGAGQTAPPMNEVRAPSVLLLRGPLNEPVVQVERPPGRAADSMRLWRSGGG